VSVVNKSTDGCCNRRQWSSHGRRAKAKSSPGTLRKKQAVPGVYLARERQLIVSTNLRRGRLIVPNGQRTTQRDPGQRGRSLLEGVRSGPFPNVLIVGTLAHRPSASWRRSLRRHVCSSFNCLRDWKQRHNGGGRGPWQFCRPSTLARSSGATPAHLQVLVALLGKNAFRNFNGSSLENCAVWPIQSAPVSAVVDFAGFGHIGTIARC